MWWRGYGLHSQSIWIPTVSLSKWAKSPNCGKKIWLWGRYYFIFASHKGGLVLPPVLLVGLCAPSRKKLDTFQWDLVGGCWICEGRCRSVLVWTWMKGQMQEFSFLHDDSLFPHCCFFTGADVWTCGANSCIVGSGHLGRWFDLAVFNRSVGPWWRYVRYWVPFCN